MERKFSVRWTGILIAGASAVLLLVAVIAFTSGEPREAAPAAASPVPTSPGEGIVAVVDGETINRAEWLEAVALDQLMSRLANVTIPVPRDTLERMINERLMLENGPPVEEPTAEDVATYILRLESNWGIDETQLNLILEDIDEASRVALEATVTRLLTVQRQQEALEAQGVPVTEWVAEQREAAEIVIYEEQINAGRLPERVLQAMATFPPATNSSSPAATPASSPLTTPDVALTTAPDFSLPQVGGAEFTLSEQLAEGPVVLIFFQKCG
ncbi:MAG: hypothetical protein PVI59_00140 [Anaerolineae bacterium]|jgi:hypothetical protein